VQPAESHIVVGHQRDLAAGRGLSADPAAERIVQPVLIAETGGAIALGAGDGARGSRRAALDGAKQLMLLGRLVELLREALDIGDEAAQLVEVGRRARAQAASRDHPHGKEDIARWRSRIISRARCMAVSRPCPRHGSIDLDQGRAGLWISSFRDGHYGQWPAFFALISGHFSASQCP